MISDVEFFLGWRLRVIRFLRSLHVFGSWVPHHAVCSELEAPS